MGITQSLINIREKMHESMREYNFNKANKEREKLIQLQTSMVKCNGQLEVSKKDFNRVIRKQCSNIKEGKKIGADTTLQEQMLWDAAMGYMLVKEAIYSLKSVNSYDSVEHAYDVLDVAINHLSGKDKGKLKLPKLGVKSRKEYEFLASDELKQRKEELLDSFFEKLKDNGDIEKCLAEADNPDNTNAARRNQASGKGRADKVATSEVDDILNSIPNDEEDSEEAVDESIMDINNLT